MLQPRHVGGDAADGRVLDPQLQWRLEHAVLAGDRDGAEERALEFHMAVDGFAMGGDFAGGQVEVADAVDVGPLLDAAQRRFKP